MKAYKSFIVIKNHIFIYTLVLLTFFGIFTAINHWSHRQEVHQTRMDMTYLKSYRLNDLGRQEKYNKYLDFSIRIWNVYGNTYHRPSKLFKVPKAMSLPTRHKVWQLNFELAELMGFADNGYGYYYIFTKGAMESGLDPNSKGAYGERTWLQLKDIAIVYAIGIYHSHIPSRWKRELKFDYNGDLDSVGSEDALRIAYILAWWYKKIYKDQKIWGVSTYHWGDGWFGSHFHNGFGTLPEKFTISGQEYDPLDYYVTWGTLNDAFNNGQIEAGKSISADYQKRKTRMLAEERLLLGNKKSIKKMSKKMRKVEVILLKKDALIEQGIKEIAELNTIILQAEKELRETSGNVGNWQRGDIRAYMKSRAELTSRNVLKALRVDYRENKTRFIAFSSAIIGSIVLNGLLIFFLSFFRRKNG